MSARPSTDDLQRALGAAGAAHHDYEQNLLKGQHDQLWSGWYAAYVLGRLGDFATPTALSRWLAEVEADGEWAPAAARHVDSQLGG